MSDTTERSPRITHISWGRMEIEGVGSGRDFKLWPGGGRAWDWNETGTRHSPGIQPADIEELVAHGSRIVILARGMERRLEVCPETIEYLETHDLEYHIEETNAAAKLYSQLVDEGQPVGGLFHSTC